jgi:hypothetical protein
MRRWLASTILIMLSICALPADSHAAAADYCADSKRSILFLIDRTTAYDERDQQVLVDGLDRFFKELGTGDRLLLYTIGGSAADSRRLFDACVPGCPEGGLLDSLFGACKPVVARADRQEFTRKLLGTLLDLLKKNVHYDASAILETVRTVVETNRDAHVERLVMFSDMLENSDVLTVSALVKDGPKEAIARVEAAGALPRVAGIDVDAFGTGRSHAPGRPALSTSMAHKLETFWTGVFERGGASRVAVGPEYSPG